VARPPARRPFLAVDANEQPDARPVVVGKPTATAASLSPVSCWLSLPTSLPSSSSPQKAVKPFSLSVQFPADLESTSEA